MKRDASLVLTLVVAFALAALPVAGQRPAAQNPVAPPPQSSSPQNPATDEDEDEVVRITTNLVQVDAVVVDKNGRQVTDLRPEEFRIYEDGREQQITNFSYINIAAPNAPERQVATRREAARNAAPIPPVRLRPEQVRRTIALVVDDLQMSRESMGFLKSDLKKYVDRQVQPGDLVALIRTRGGMGTLQQFTSDKRQLYAAIDKLRWYPNGGGGLTPFDAPDPITAAVSATAAQSAGDGGIDQDREGISEINEARRRLFAVGTLGALSSVVNGLRELPGRKAVVLFSDGFEILQYEKLLRGTGIVSSDQILEVLRNLIDRANRASVVIHTIDSRGLQAFNINAGPVISGANRAGTSGATSSGTEENANKLWQTQAGLAYLSENTGGLAIRNSNGINEGINRVLEDQNGYYLLGYRPDERTFDPAKGREFRNLKIQVRRAGLKVRTRSGFYGRTDSETRAPRDGQPQQTRAQQLMAALASPFSAGQIELRLTSLFGNEPATGSYMRSLLHLDARSLSFDTEPDGSRKAVVDVMAVTLGADGRPVDEVNVTQTLTARGDTYERLLENGLDYVLNVPIKQAGAYQLRVAVRDTKTERTGSASQFIEVPDLSKKRLALSGIALTGRFPMPGNVVQTSAPQQSPVAANVSAPFTNDASAQSGPTVRRVRQGMNLDYGLVVYNAQLDARTRLPQLNMQVRLLRDGKIVYQGPSRAVETGGQADLQRLVVGGSLQTGQQLAPGEYILQVIVTDALAREKHRMATQWIDFEIIG
jgi:VWFA-related protein